MATMENRKLVKRFLLTLLLSPIRLPLLILRLYFTTLIRLSGVTAQQTSFPRSVFLDPRKYPVASVLLFLPSLAGGCVLYILKLLKLVVVPEIVFRQFVSLVLFQSLYEFSGLWWRSARWAYWTNVSCF